MSIVLSDKIYTIEDYMKLDDGQRYELIGSKLIVVPRPRLKHQKISGRIYTRFENFLEQNPIGEVYSDVDVHLGDKVVAPDVLFIAKERLNIAEVLNVQGAPDLVVQILSPSTAAYDKKEKSQLYCKHGVKEYWLVYPEIMFIDVFVLGKNKWHWIGAFNQEDVLTTALLPGLEISLNEIFRDERGK